MTPEGAIENFGKVMPLQVSTARNIFRDFPDFRVTCMGLAGIQKTEEGKRE